MDGGSLLEIFFFGYAYSKFRGKKKTYFYDLKDLEEVGDKFNVHMNEIHQIVKVCFFPHPIFQLRGY